MSNNGSQFNVTKWLRDNVGSSTSPNTGKVYNLSKSNSTSTSTAGAKASTIGQILAYILAIAVVIIVILLFINYFITPIFRLKPGGPGIIPIPGFDDGKLFWSNTSPGQIQNKDLPIVSLYYGYTINLDVFVENPLQFATTPRIFFSRGAIRKEKPSGDTILGTLDNYNLVAALLPDTNDLLVSVLNKDNNMENIIVPNIPVQEPFRLTMVVMQQALEVYINGRLLKTRKFLAEPKDTKGDIYPASGIESNAIKVRNLKIWSRILSVSEIRESTPKLSSAKNFGAGPMPSSTSCISSAVNNVMDDTQKAIDRYSKLSVDSVSDGSSSLL
jgi:hypothetical protein